MEDKTKVEKATAKISLNKSKNMYKILFKNLTKRQVDIPEAILAAELYDFNITIEKANTKDEAQIFYFKFKNKLESLTSTTQAITTEEEDQEYIENMNLLVGDKMNTIQTYMRAKLSEIERSKLSEIEREKQKYISNIQANMRAKMSNIEKQKKISNLQDKNSLKEELNNLFNEQINLYKSIIEDKISTPENKNKRQSYLNFLVKGRNKIINLINKYYDTIYIDVLIDLIKSVIICLRKNEINEMTILINEFENKYSLNLHRTGSKDIDFSIIKRTRIDLSLYNVSQYREERKKAQLEYTRKMDPKASPTIELFNNQIDRFEIIKEEEKEYEKIKAKYEDDLPIAIETLQQIIDPRIIYDQEFALKVQEYNKFLEDIKKYGDQF